MSGSIKRYQNHSQPRLYELCIGTNDYQGINAIGHTSRNGLFCQFNTKGNIENSIEYIFDGQILTLARLERTLGPKGEDVGGFLALGYVPTSNRNRRQYILLRVKKDGAPIWALKLFTNNTRFMSSLQCSKGVISVAGWHNLRGSSDKIEYFKFTIDGALISSNKFSAGSDDQITQHYRYGDKDILLGSSGQNGLIIHKKVLRDDAARGSTYNHKRSRKNIVFDNLSVAWMNGPSPTSPKIYVPMSSGTSLEGRRKQTLLFPVLEKEIEGHIFQASSGSDKNIALQAVGIDLYLLGQAVGGREETYVIKYNLRQGIIWRKELDLGKEVSLTDLKLNLQSGDDARKIVICGFQKTKGDQYSPYLIQTDLELNSCKTINSEVPKSQTLHLVPISEKIEDIKIEVKVERVDIKTIEIKFEAEQVCPKFVNEQPELTDGVWLQSPHIYLQAVGSLGDIATRGHLLRWMFLRHLGDNHFPKGNYSNTRVGFNKKDDFVHVYRAPYKEPEPVRIELFNQRPNVIDNQNRRWVYLVKSNPIYLEFEDIQAYDQILTSIDPNANFDEFLSTYGFGKLRLNLRDNLAFQLEIYGEFNNGDHLDAECYSVQGLHFDEADAIFGRRSINQNSGSTLTFLEENIQSVRFRGTNACFRSFSLYLYSNLLEQTLQANSFLKLGEYALSLDDQDVFNRLEDGGKVHAHWKKFNGSQTVNVQNYKTRWSESNDGLKAGVQDYLHLSETDPKAIKTYPKETDGGFDSADISFSLHDLLVLTSMDYHNARELGMGVIDHPTEDESEQFIYMAIYNTDAPLAPGESNNPRQHIYLSLPTAMRDERLPREVTTRIGYGLQVNQGAIAPVQISDAQGYVPFEMVRYIKIFSELLSDPQIQSGFMSPASEFSYSEHTNPVFAHLNYKSLGETNWREPCISTNRNYFDNSSPPMPEVTPISIRIDHDDPVFVHEETEEGVHLYNAQPIDIYSRSPSIGQDTQTNHTRFTKPNTLLPPHNLRAQIIQPEDANQLLLTTETEQQLLSAITNSDKSLVRVSFTYDHVHDLNYGFADKIEFIYRKDLLRETAGQISTVSQNENDNFIWVTTQNYVYDSTGVQVTPEIDPASKNNFIGGVLVCEGTRYTILDIITSGSYPTFKLLKIVDRQTRLDSSGRTISVTELLDFAGTPNSRFIAIENLAKSESWEPNAIHEFNVSLDPLNATTQDDNFIDPQGKTVTRELRGFWDDAIVQHGSVTGAYKITFQNFTLNHHPQHQQGDPNFVDYYQGVVRVPIDGQVKSDGDPILVLDVQEIEYLGDSHPIVLHVRKRDSDVNFTPLMGQIVRANFYPGYRAYLVADTNSNFVQSNLFPNQNEGIRKSLFSARSFDTQTRDSASNPYASDVAAAINLFAVEIIEAQRPQRPLGAAFTTPPDFYKKSSYSFETEFTDRSFGAVYYRANTLAVLSALYKIETFNIVLDTIGSPAENEFYTNHIQDIFNVLEGSQSPYPDGTFSSFPLDNGTYHLPNPDNSENGFSPNGSDLPASKVEFIKAAILEVFTPLTEHPLILNKIRGGDYVPKSTPQITRDKYGNNIDPEDPEFDLAPMAVKVDGSAKVRFTDFAIDGGAKSDHGSLLYMVREIGNRMDLSEASAPLGPIQFVDKIPPSAPIVQKLQSITQDDWLGVLPSVELYVNAYSKGAQIKYFELLRATNPQEALSPRTMTRVGFWDLDTLPVQNGIVKIVDDFADLDNPPFGELLTYKVIAHKEIKYENHLQQWIIEQVPSQPSINLMTNVVDVMVPEQPILQVQNAGIDQNGFLTGLSLSWNATTHNGKYHLERQNSRGNWKRVVSIASNVPAELQFSFTEAISTQNDDGDKVYNRFRVSAENSSSILGPASIPIVV